MLEHQFTGTIRSVLQKHFGEFSNEVLERSILIQYLNEKTKSANRGSKSRPNFASLYAVYVLVEDYVSKGFNIEEGYTTSEGAEYAKLFARQRQLPFGNKLQNHALNNRMNSEFHKFFPKSEFTPILRDTNTNRYWINESLLKISTGTESYNLAASIIEIIDEYVKAKQDSLYRFIKTCEELANVNADEEEKVLQFQLA